MSNQDPKNEKDFREKADETISVSQVDNNKVEKTKLDDWDDWHPDSSI